MLATSRRRGRTPAATSAAGTVRSLGQPGVEKGGVAQNFFWLPDRHAAGRRAPRPCPDQRSLPPGATPEAHPGLAPLFRSQARLTPGPGAVAVANRPAARFRCDKCGDRGAGAPGVNHDVTSTAARRPFGARSQASGRTPARGAQVHAVAEWSRPTIACDSGHRHADVEHALAIIDASVRSGVRGRVRSGGREPGLRRWRSRVIARQPPVRSHSPAPLLGERRNRDLHHLAVTGGAVKIASRSAQRRSGNARRRPQRRAMSSAARPCIKLRRPEGIAAAVR
jgi:hypothetical protein